MKKTLLLSALAVSATLFAQTSYPGNYCGMTPARPLLNDFEMQLNKKNYNFTGKTPQADKVNVGWPCGSKPSGKLNVYVDTTTDYFSPEAYGITVENYASAAAYNNYGVYCQVLNYDGTPTGQYGIYGTTYGGQKSVGVYGSAVSGGLSAQSGAYGGEFLATGGTNGYNWGIYAKAANATVANWAGYFDGDVVINAGSGTYALTVNGSSWQSAGTTWATSDKKFKKDIVKLEGVTERLKKINGYIYSFKTEEFPDRHFDKTPTIGFLAQELKETFPQLVMTDPNGDLAVNYQGMIPVLLQSIKEQQQQLDDQRELIDELLQRAANATGINTNNTGTESFKMEQNEPNPFTHETVVKYTLPTSVNSAYMAVYDLSGKQITSFKLEQMGVASITITSEKLSAGIYIYSIVADGKVLDSKRMIVADK